MCSMCVVYEVEVEVEVKVEIVSGAEGKMEPL
jgi:hypothetical protein